MTQELGIARAEIDPEDFLDATVAVEPVGRPEESFVAVVVEPLAVSGEKGLISIIRRFPRGEGYIVSWNVLLRGGVDRDLRFVGMLEEAKLRYRSKRDLPENSMPSNAWMFPG